jgi:hypothetical protein|tara:strand:+ start:154 stop:627 length:474 start_codon:yes stop_codon:yes gene_type:complete
MKKLQKGRETVYIFENYLSKRECKRYASTIKDLGVGNFDWPSRTQDITKDPIAQKVGKFLNKKFNLNLKIEQAQTQNWNQTSSSELHIHTYRPNTTYSSSIYLNEDFGGGLFFTKNGIKVKPKIGLLTFFNGSNVWHGVEKVKDKDRKTLIFWWSEK